MNILFVLPRCPWPPYVGQSRLAFYRARELRKRGHRVALFCYGSNINLITPQQLEELSLAFDSIISFNLTRFLFAISLFRAIPRFLFLGCPLIAVGLTPSRIKHHFSELLSRNDFDIIHFYSIRSFPLWAVADHFRAKFVVDLVDSMTLNFEKRISTASFFMRSLLMLELPRIRSFESGLPPFISCLSYLVVGEKDLCYLTVSQEFTDSFACKKNSSVFPSIQACSIGVEPFADIEISPSIRDSPRIIFFGSLSYTPNVQALEWFVGDIYPLLVIEFPGIEFLVVGSKPSGRVISICQHFSSIILVPNPSSIAPYLFSSFASVAPMVSGSGQQFKVIESLANSIPCVATSLAVEPLGLTNDVNVCTADSPEEFAHMICKLYSNKQYAASIASRGQDYVNNHFSWQSSAAFLEKIYIS